MRENVRIADTGSQSLSSTLSNKSPALFPSVSLILKRSKLNNITADYFFALETKPAGGDLGIRAD